MATATAMLLGALIAAAPAAGAPASGSPPQIAARAWVLIDARSGDRLAGRMTARRLPVASATKLMTAHLALKKLPLERRLSAPPYRARPAESKINLRPGERMSVRELLEALLLESANDAAVTLATGVSGSVPRFVAAMNREARALGLGDTHYANPVGLDAPGNRSSARDLAALTRRLMRDPAFRRIVDTPSVVLRTGSRPRRIVTRNRLVQRVPWVTGVKTGHTLAAGYVLVGSASRRGVSLVSVVLGAGSEAARESATLSLLEYGFDRFRSVTPVRRGARLARPEVRHGGSRLELAAVRSLRLTVRRGQSLATRVEAPAEVEGPITRGEQLGRAIATVDGRQAGAVPLVATRAVSAPGFADRARERVESPGTLLALGAIVTLIGIVLARRRPA